MDRRRMNKLCILNSSLFLNYKAKLQLGPHNKKISINLVKVENSVFKFSNIQ